MALHPQAITLGQTSSPVSPPPRPSISGWLLCVSSSIRSPLRPQHDSFYIIFLLPQSSPKRWDNVSPHAPTPARPLSNITSTAIIIFWLVVVFFIKFWPLGWLPSCFSDFWEVSVQCPEQGNQPRWAQTWCRTPCLGTLVASVPCVGGATGLPMEGEG